MITNILQTKSWEKFLNDEGNQTFRLEGKGYVAMCVLKTTPVGNYLFLPYGPALESQKYLNDALKAVKELAEKQSAIFIRIEPTTKLSQNNIKTNKLKKTKDLDPKHTVILNLSPDEDEIIQNMDHAKRNTYRNYSKKGLTIRQTKDPKDAKILIDFLNRITESRHFSTHSDEYIANQLKYDFATLYIAEYENQPIAASLCYDSEDTRYYAHSAANDEFRKQRPTDAILTQMIVDAKRKGQKYFDFWGATTSNDPKDPWYGFTKYKLSFGGQITSYAGTYDIILKNAKYTLYKTLRKANRLKRKILH